MDKTKETFCINVLQKILDNNIDDDWYSLNGPKESAICLECNGTLWSVYDKERNSKNDAKVFDNVVEACLEMIERLFERTERMYYKNIFLNNIIKDVNYTG